MMTDWNSLRGDYPAVSRFLYADNAAVGAIPTSATDAAIEVLRELAEEGMIAYGRRKGGLASVRQDMANLLGATPADIGFTDCTSMSMNMLAMMAAQEWQKGNVSRKKLVVLRDEFPSSTLGWLTQGFEPVWVESEPDGRYPVDKVMDAITPDCRAVLTSEVQYKTGVVVDVGTIGRALADRDLLYIVNATQSAGVIPQAATDNGYSALTVSSVKWLCAGVGTGTVYLSEKMRQQCRMPVAGWMSQTDPFAMLNDQVLTTSDASAMETGAVELSRLYALQTCLGITQSIGVEAIRERVLYLNGLLIKGLEQQGATVITPHEDSGRSSIVSVQRDNALAWKDWAMEQNMLVSLRGENLIRLSLHFFNNEQDVEQLLNAWRDGP